MEFLFSFEAVESLHPIPCPVYTTTQILETLKSCAVLDSGQQVHHDGTELCMIIFKVLGRDLIL